MALTRASLEDRYLSRWRVSNYSSFDWPDRYNIRPTQLSPVIVANGENHLELMRFGLVPSWSKTEKLEFSTINATVERVDLAPTYKKPFREKRCLVLVDGFYEFLPITLDGKPAKQPYYFRVKGDGPFVLAAIYDVNAIATDKPIKSYSIITVPANDLVGEVHPRMPAILTLEAALDYLNLDTDPDRLKALLTPYPEEDMESWKVARLVNFNRNEGPELIKPI
jgi:putative SOS response-associated peptidase YedK